MNLSFSWSLGIFLCLMMCIGCRTDAPMLTELETLNIRLTKDPNKLNPVFNPSASSREIFQYIFVPLADYHPETLELYPILIEEIPEGKVRTEAPYNGDLVFDITIREDARWTDGKPVTAEDYAFTVKAVKLPLSNARAWRSLFKYIKNVIPDKNNPKKFQVVMDKDHMLAKEIALTCYILPHHIYDKSAALKQFPNDINYGDDFEADDNITSFATTFNSTENLRDTLVGAGPYVLNSWTTNQSIVLQKKANYWGNKFPNNPFLKAGTEKMVFKIIPDDNTALTAFKGDQIDVLPIANASLFDELKKDENYKDKAQFLSPSLIRYYYIALNNIDEKLTDKRVRRAIAHLFDMQSILNTIEYGYGDRIIGHFNPAKSYYNTKLKPIPFDIDKSIQLLKEAGWEDSNGDGIVDKKINNTHVEMNLEILITGSSLSENISLLVQEAAKKAGINLSITRKKMSIINSENIGPKKYNLVALVISQDAAPDDPYDRWHSDNIDEGRNFYSYSNHEADKLMVEIRKEYDESKRKDLYLKLQEIMYEDQPVIWLYCPRQKVILDADLSAKQTSKRPGYLANTFSRKVSVVN